MLPVLGKMVKYTLSQEDIAALPPGGLKPGQELPAVIVNPGYPPSTCVNLHVFLDGRAAGYYVMASPNGRGEGQWSDLPLS